MTDYFSLHPLHSHWHGGGVTSMLLHWEEGHSALSILYSPVGIIPQCQLWQCFLVAYRVLMSLPSHGPFCHILMDGKIMSIVHMTATTAGGLGVEGQVVDEVCCGGVWLLWWRSIGIGVSKWRGGGVNSQA